MLACPVQLRNYVGEQLHDCERTVTFRTVSVNFVGRIMGIYYSLPYGGMSLSSWGTR